MSLSMQVSCLGGSLYSEVQYIISNDHIGPTVQQTLTCENSGGSKGGRRGHAPPPGGPNSFDFMQFLGNFGKIVCWRPPWGVGAPSSGKSWIRHSKTLPSRNFVGGAVKIGKNEITWHVLL